MRRRTQQVNGHLLAIFQIWHAVVPKQAGGKDKFHAKQPGSALIVQLEVKLRPPYKIEEVVKK
jgi:hypothetical protein